MLDARRNRAADDRKEGFCWKRRTNLEKLFILVIVLLCIIIIWLVVRILIKKEKVCTSPECVQASAIILKYIDPSQDPCQDFYKFVCGTYVKNAFVEESPSPLTIADSKTKRRMQEIVMEPIGHNDAYALKLMKQYYQACLEGNKQEDRIRAALVKTLKKLGGWPLLDGPKWTDTNFDWISFYKRKVEIGISGSLFIFLDKHEDDDTGLNILKITHGIKCLNVSKTAFIDFITKIAIYVGVPKENLVEINSIVNFDNVLQQAICSVKKKSNIKVAPLQKIYEMFPSLQRLIQQLVQTNITADTSVLYDEDKIPEILNILNITSKRTQANYLMLNTLLSYVTFLPDDILKAYVAFLVQSGVAADLTPRHDLCESHATKKFKHVKELTYIKQMVDAETKAQMTEMINYIQDEFYSRLSKANWMDKKTKDFALDKVRAMESYIGAPDELFNDTFVEKVLNLTNFKFSSDNIIEMDQERLKQMMTVYYQEFYNGTPEDNYDEFIKYSSSLNAYFTQDLNRLVLPAPILQDLFYNKKFPKFMNYGSIGRIIGHEIMHGFQESGRYLLHENLTEFDWWTNKTAEEYQKTVECVIKLYDAFPNQDLKTNNGSLTLEENVCDFVGIDASYDAYQTWSKKHGAEQKLPGLDYTPNQLYWIQANNWICFKNFTSDKFVTEEGPDDHGVAPFRVNAGLQNSEYFAKDFDCPIDSPMNPREKCRIL